MLGRKQRVRDGRVRMGEGTHRQRRQGREEGLARRGDSRPERRASSECTWPTKVTQYPTGEKMWTGRGTGRGLDTACLVKGQSPLLI